MNVLQRNARKLCKFAENLHNQSRLKGTFRAAVLTKKGEPLSIQERPIEKLKSKQVRVKVAYVSVNSVDCHKFRHGGGELPFIPGYELAGEVIEKGKDVGNEIIRVGERVAGLSLMHFGGFAEQCILDIDDVWRIPGDVERKDAAVLAYGHSTAIYTFSKLSNLKEKEKIVISTGPAGMGLAAVDVAANIYGASVLGVVDNEALGELVRERGALSTFIFNSNLDKEVKKATENKGVNIVYDAVGDHMMTTLKNCATFCGKIFYAAPNFLETMSPPPPHTFFSIVSLKALREQKRNLYKTVVSDTLELANNGSISAHISAKFELEDVNKAIEFIEQKKCTGKVLIHID
ncbi:quinone oxidoreductase-like protein 2 homolog [Aethina tumida]|uniref:quinone oxidoreductase-like protein 2 homolog n=1 Tax=Aethina tumida TaxID=116153 RepID=UPI00096B6557|nr:quinone oxidoreductase-like protein 2 homolog [Aethina tumida]